MLKRHVGSGPPTKGQVIQPSIPAAHNEGELKLFSCNANSLVGDVNNNY